MLGSIMALWSAKGAWQRNFRWLFRSNAAQPPSQFCMASSQRTPRSMADIVSPMAAVSCRFFSPVAAVTAASRNSGGRASRTTDASENCVCNANNAIAVSSQLG